MLKKIDFELFELIKLQSISKKNKQKIQHNINNIY